VRNQSRLSRREALRLVAGGGVITLATLSATTCGPLLNARGTPARLGYLSTSTSMPDELAAAPRCPS